ncbi:MAG TPA: hypothetical protein DCP25_08435 [Chloroflexi bacterium]|jgi:hypothetical protein|nr:hypothetical protein [Chloroflexota bacterium]
MDGSGLVGSLPSASGRGGRPLTIDASGALHPADREPLAIDAYDADWLKPHEHDSADERVEFPQSLVVTERPFFGHRSPLRRYGHQLGASGVKRAP